MRELQDLLDQRAPLTRIGVVETAECQQRLGNEAEAGKTRERFDASWEQATVVIKASCFCRTK